MSSAQKELTPPASPSLPQELAPAYPTLPRVVIIGGGFGGITAATSLARLPVEVVLIDKYNYHLFQPLLYQVATAALSPAEIAAPIRGILREQKNARVMLGHVTGIDTARRCVMLEERSVPYDTLIISTGVRNHYFGHDEWAQVAPGLKTIADARALRHKMLGAFERAESETDLEERRRLMTFVVIGGGATGVEMAGAIAEVARVAITQDFRNIDTKMSRVVLIEAGTRLLPSMPEKLSAAAKRSLEKLGVEVWLGKYVTDCDSGGVTLGAERIGCRTIVWAAGIIGSPAASWLNAAHDREGRVIVEPDLTVAGHPEIFVIGDTAMVRDKAGNPLPGVAPAAKQEAHYVAKLIKARLEGKPPPKPFRYINLGNLATIGRSAAVADFGFVRFSGLLAWLGWGLIHIYFLIGFRSRFIVAITWLWSYFTFQRGARLIMSDEPEA